MTRWVMGSMVGGLAIAPVGYAGITPEGFASVARVVSGALLVMAVVFVGLGAAWSRRWAI